jgi:hypothetical protein
MPPEEKDQPLTREEAQELLINMRQTQSDVSSLKDDMKEMRRIVAGNGRFKDSLAGRLQIVEERQMVGATKQASDHKEICQRLINIENSVDIQSRYLERNHSRISDVEVHLQDEKDERLELAKRQSATETTIAKLVNRAIGIGIGSGVGTGGALVGISKIIELITSSIP